ncbi:hypothetical protein D7X88_15235 [bacterium C-53]|nr:hypothetical protein [Lachnospiraceae bacterium]NBI04318.1 hypothetical protein [Lachnospiraceae bacterium]RKJ08319.1 hypothetical protein D7X88_15235 [bacterium C-53]
MIGVNTRKWLFKRPEFMGFSQKDDFLKRKIPYNRALWYVPSLPDIRQGGVFMGFLIEMRVKQKRV